MKVILAVLCVVPSLAQLNTASALDGGDAWMKSCKDECALVGGTASVDDYNARAEHSESCQACLANNAPDEAARCTAHGDTHVPIDSQTSIASATTVVESATWDPNTPYNGDGECSKSGKHIVVVGTEFQEGKYPYIDGGVGGPVTVGSLEECERLCLVMADCEYGTFVTTTVDAGTTLLTNDPRYTYNHGRPAVEGECWLSNESHDTRVACGVPCVGFRKETVDTAQPWSGQERTHMHGDKEEDQNGVCFVSEESDDCCDDTAECWDGSAIHRSGYVDSSGAQTGHKGGPMWCAFDYAKECPPKPPCTCDPSKAESAFTTCKHDEWTNHVVVSHLAQRFHGAPVSDHQQHRCMSVTDSSGASRCACCDCDASRNQDSQLRRTDYVDMGLGRHLAGDVLKFGPTPCTAFQESKGLCTSGAMVMNMDICVATCEEREAGGLACHWGTYSEEHNTCYIGTGEPQKQADGTYKLSKCPVTLIAGECGTNEVWDVHTHECKPCEMVDGQCHSSAECHTFMLNAGAGHDVRTFMRGVAARDPVARTAVAHNDRSAATYNLCQWDASSAQCEVNHAWRFERPTHGAVRANQYTEGSFQWPHVQHDVVVGWTRDRCVNAMKAGQHVQWKCEGDAAKPFRIIKTTCPAFFESITAAMSACTNLGAGSAEEAACQTAANAALQPDGRVTITNFLCTAYQAGQCGNPLSCNPVEVSEHGSASAISTKAGFTADVFGCAHHAAGQCDGRWQVGDIPTAEQPYIQYEFSSPKEITRIALWQYWRSGNCRSRGCCGNTVSKVQYNGDVVKNFCEDNGSYAGSRSDFYCKKIAVQWSDDGSTWSSHAGDSANAMEFHAQIDYNSFSFNAQGATHTHWRLKCLDETPPSQWQLGLKGIQLYEAESGCTNDGLGARQWVKNTPANNFQQYGPGCDSGCCIAGCACHLGCSAITSQLAATTQSECSKSASATAWDGAQCVNTAAAAECAVTQDHLTLVDTSSYSSISECQHNQRYVPDNVGAATTNHCLPCEPGYFQDVENHYLTECAACPSDVTTCRSTVCSNRCVSSV